MARPRIVTDEEREEAGRAFTEGMRVRVTKSPYTKHLPFLQKDSLGTVLPREGWTAIIEVRMDGDPGGAWPWYPEEIEAI